MNHKVYIPPKTMVILRTKQSSKKEKGGEIKKMERIDRIVDRYLECFAPGRTKFFDKCCMREADDGQEDVEVKLQKLLLAVRHEGYKEGYIEGLKGGRVEVADIVREIMESI